MLEKKFNCFQPRAVTFREVRRYKDWRFKVYTLTWDGSEINWPAYENGLAETLALLPTPAVTPRRPGVGFLICHSGGQLHYLVRCFWDLQNECVTKVYVCPGDDDRGWHEAIDESFCVWDMEIMWHEREVYVGTLLSGRERDMIEEYLAKRFTS